MTNPAIFLDRDGTLIEDVGYPSRPEQIRILAGVARALVRLAGAGYKLIVVTNQSGIARGILTEDDLNRFHQALDEQLELLGSRLDAYYSCPHLPDPAAAVREDLAVVCDCRKPKPGLILQAAQDLELDLAASWTVGDKWRDIACGQAAGTRTIKLPSALGTDSPRPADVDPPTAEVSGLDEATTFILNHPERRPDPDEPDEAPAAEAAPAEAAPAAEPEAEPVAAPAPPVAEPPAPEPAPEQVEEVAEIEEDEEEVVEEPAAPAPEIAQTPAEPAEEEVPPPPAPPAEPAEPASSVLPRAGWSPRREEPAVAESPHAAPAADVPTTLLREVLSELRRLDRSRHPSSLSLLRLLAYLLQVGAGACLVLGLVSAERMTFLLITCICLLVSLTLLVIERRP